MMMKLEKETKRYGLLCIATCGGKQGCRVQRWSKAELVHHMSHTKHEAYGHEVFLASLDWEACSTPLGTVLSARRLGGRPTVDGFAPRLSLLRPYLKRKTSK